MWNPLIVKSTTPPTHRISVIRDSALPARGREGEAAKQFMIHHPRITENQQLFLTCLPFGFGGISAIKKKTEAALLAFL